VHKPSTDLPSFKEDYNSPLEAVKEEQSVYSEMRKSEEDGDLMTDSECMTENEIQTKKPPPAEARRLSLFRKHKSNNRKNSSDLRFNDRQDS